MVEVPQIAHRPHGVEIWSAASRREISRVGTAADGQAPPGDHRRDHRPTGEGRVHGNRVLHLGSPGPGSGRAPCSTRSPQTWPTTRPTNARAQLGGVIANALLSLRRSAATCSTRLVI